MSPSGSWDIVKEARRQAQEARRAEEEARRARQDADARQRRQQAARAISEARKWAVPILEETFGHREHWDLINARREAMASHTDYLVDVIISDEPRKVLTVHRMGKIVTGHFQTRASGGRYGVAPAAYGNFTIKSLLHLGELLEQEWACVDEELRNAD